MCLAGDLTVFGDVTERDRDHLGCRRSKDHPNMLLLWPLGRQVRRDEQANDEEGDGPETALPRVGARRAWLVLVTDHGRIECER